MGAALNFLTQCEEDGNDLLERIIISAECLTHIYEPKRKLASMVWKKKWKKRREIQERAVRWAGNVNGLLGLLWLGPDVSEEKRNVTQGAYFDSLMHLRNLI